MHVQNSKLQKSSKKKIAKEAADRSTLKKMEERRPNTKRTHAKATRATQGGQQQLHKIHGNLQKIQPEPFFIHYSTT